MAASSRETSITSNQWDIESFGQGDESRIVRSYRVPQLPHPVDERNVRIARDVQVAKVGADILRAIGMEIAGRDEAPQSVQYFDVEQVRGVEVGIRIQPPE